jgi:dienelactone hydrolase
MFLLRYLLIFSCLEIASGAGNTALEGSPFTARDTLAADLEPQPDAAACLAGLRWTAADFRVSATAAPRDSDWLLRFPSPFPSGDSANDAVALEWYVHRDAQGEPVKAPAVVVIHESGRGMAAGRAFALGLRFTGCHTFLMHLPGYGARTSPLTGDMKQVFPGLRQGIADARRARDAVAALPLVDSSNIGICGISLGGFVTSTVVGLDRGYDRGFILLAGGHLADVVFKGEKDAATLRQQLQAAGVTDEAVRAAIWTIEPLRLAHRADPDKVWLFSASQDEVVPPACSAAYVKAARLPEGHHAEYAAGHYTAALFAPHMIRRISEVMLPVPVGILPSKPER